MVLKVWDTANFSHILSKIDSLYFNDFHFEWIFYVYLKKNGIFDSIT